MEINKFERTQPMNVTNVQESKLQPKVVQEDKKLVQEDKVEISKDALIAAEVQKQMTPSASGKFDLKMTAEQRAELVNQLKQDIEINNAKFIDYVKTTFISQGQNVADGDAFWKFMADGDYVVDAATKEKAQEAISEKGYFGVEQVSSRLYEFALALTGGDADKMKKMEEAFEEGFKAATKAWGKELPEISNKTFDAVKDKFANFYKSLATSTEE